MIYGYIRSMNLSLLATFGNAALSAAMEVGLQLNRVETEHVQGQYWMVNKVLCTRKMKDKWLQYHSNGTEKRMVPLHS